MSPTLRHALIYSFLCKDGGTPTSASQRFVRCELTAQYRTICLAFEHSVLHDKVFCCIFFLAGYVRHFFAYYVAHFVSFRDVWIRTQIAAVARRCYQLSHPSPLKKVGAVLFLPLQLS
jgi:hypothetical protein